MCVFCCCFFVVVVVVFAQKILLVDCPFGSVTSAFCAPKYKVILCQFSIDIPLSGAIIFLLLP